jgi:hypothetical protein
LRGPAERVWGAGYLVLTHGRGRRAFWETRKSDTVGADPKRSTLADRTDSKAKDIAAIGV